MNIVLIATMLALAMAAGGWAELSLTNSDVQAVSEYVSSTVNIGATHLVKAQRQIVNGHVYLLQYTNDGGVGVHNVKVLRKHDGTFHIISSTPVNFHAILNEEFTEIDINDRKVQAAARFSAKQLNLESMVVERAAYRVVGGILFDLDIYGDLSGELVTYQVKVLYHWSGSFYIVQAERI